MASLVLMTSALPAGAHVDLAHPDHSHAGGSSGDAIWVSVGASGGAKGSYPSCPWQRGWPSGSGSVESRAVPSLIRMILGDLGFPFGDPGDPATVELVPIGEADLDGDGEVDQDFIVPILADEDEYVIGETEGLNWINELGLRLLGTHDLGVLIADSNADVDPDLLTEAELEGAKYRESGSYPIIQRGLDPRTGDDLYWDPWFVAPADQDGNCPAGVYYSPRLNNPTIMLPDLQAFVSSLLPAAVPTLIPVDRHDGWAYVQVPTNFGVTGASLVRKSAHAEVEYIDAANNSWGLWADIQAIPTHLMFEPGDGSDPVVCHLSQMHYQPDDPGDCSHVYLDSSNTAPGKVFQSRVSVLWVGIYTDSTGAGFTVDIAPTTATFDIPVAEARAAVAYGD